jgi:hypothetical protein
MAASPACNLSRRKAAFRREFFIRKRERAMAKSPRTNPFSRLLRGFAPSREPLASIRNDDVSD